MNDRTLLLRCVVGSQLHGTATPTSDTDIREVYVSSLIDMLSPFNRDRPIPGDTLVVEQSNGNEVERFEFQRFCRLLSQCNVTALEILWSDMVQYERREAQIVRKQRHAFLSSKRVHEAARGYANSQLHHVDRTMMLGEQNTDSKRRGKFAAAYVRVMHQAITLLTTGDYNPRDIGPFRDDIVIWKAEGFTKKIYQRRFNTIRAELTAALDRAYEQNADRFTQDTDAINRLVRDVYRSCEQDRIIREELAHAE